MSPLQQIGAALFIVSMLVLVAVGVFVRHDEIKTKAREATKLKKIADVLGVSEEKVTQIAVDRLYGQLFPDSQ